MWYFENIVAGHPAPNEWIWKLVKDWEPKLNSTNRSSLRLSKSSLSMTSSSVYSMQTTVAVRVHLLARATSPKHPPRSIRIGSACVKTPSPRGSFVMPTFPKLLWFSKISQYLDYRKMIFHESMKNRKWKPCLMKYMDDPIAPNLTMTLPRPNASNRTTRHKAFCIRGGYSSNDFKPII